MEDDLREIEEFFKTMTKAKIRWLIDNVENGRNELLVFLRHALNKPD